MQVVLSALLYKSLKKLIPYVLAFYDMFHVRGKTSLVVSN
jgi:hypothetical protein